MKKQSKLTIAVSGIFVVIQFITVLGYVYRNEYKHLLSLISSTLLFLTYICFHIKYKVNIKLYITCLVILTILGHNFLGEYIGLYYSSVTFDKALHIFGTLAYSLFTYSLITHFFPVSDSNNVREFIYIIAIGSLWGITFEIIEFIGDIVLKPGIPNQADLLDTNLDLINNLFGAILAAIHAHLKNYNL